VWHRETSARAPGGPRRRQRGARRGARPWQSSAWEPNPRE
jgi:hypothetical protein